MELRDLVEAKGLGGERADRALTGRVAAATAILGIELLDHVVVGATGSVSFAERGAL